MPVSLLDEANGSLLGSLELEAHNTMEHPVDGTGVMAVGHTLSVAMDHCDDPNFDSSAPSIEDESPYPEVRSAVSNTDDPSMPSSTFRSWAVGLSFTALISGMNQFFYFRYPTITVTMNVPMVLTYPICKAWARYLPNISLFGIPLNPGPFTIKEHVIITTMVDVGLGASSAYAVSITYPLAEDFINNIVVQKVLYNRHTPFGYQWLLIMSTQLMGFAIGGVCKRFLITPSSMIWPADIATAALFTTLHSQETSGTRARGGISRQCFLFNVIIGYIFYNFFPSYLFTALSSFSWVCWIAPHNSKINQLFGVTHGLAMGIFTFDWGQVTAFNGSPLAIPWWAMANCGVTIVLFYWILLPILYYTNVWYSAYLPIVSSYSFDNTGNIYNISRIINSDFSFNLQAYREYSPIFLPASFVITYGLSFASITATATHTFLYHRRLFWSQSRHRPSVGPDIHARLMSVYNEVPDWWYLIILMIMFVFGIVSIEVWETEFPVWAFMLSLFILFALIAPIGVIMAISSQEVGINGISELMIGYILPGRPIANMMFKTWCYNTASQAIRYTSDFKLGHYMKIPPRSMFFSQVASTIVAGTVQLCVQEWMFSNIEDMCSPDQKDGFICPEATVFGTASIIWGVIGPQRLFSHGQLYFGLLFFFLLGTIAPLFQWISQKQFGIKFLKYVNFPLVFSGAAFLPPATPLNYVPAMLVCFIFNYVIRRRHIDWWSKYNYVLSGGLDAGYEFGILIIFFALQYPKNGNIGLNSIQTWWGNTVYTKTDDYVGVPYKNPPEEGTFGPSSW